MQFLNFIGIDMSRNWFDAHLLKRSSSTKGAHQQFSNDKKGFRAFKKWLSQNGIKDLSQTLICMEHTGVYTVPLCRYLNSIQTIYTLIAGYEIKYSTGTTRGKTDKVDAKRIARYAYEKQDVIRMYTLPTAAIRSLRTLLSLRNRLLKSAHAFKVSNQELQKFEVLEVMTVLDKASKSMIESIDNQLIEVQSAIKQLLEQHPCIKQNYELLLSVPGIGQIIALNLIVYTQNFVSFRKSRKFATYCGIAPFGESSGKHQAQSAHVSHLANKKMKALLTNGAYAAIQNYTEFKTFYERQIKKGKKEFVVINMVKNKIIHRAFAVINRGAKYMENYTYKPAGL